MALYFMVLPVNSFSWLSSGVMKPIKSPKMQQPPCLRPDLMFEKVPGRRNRRGPSLSRTLRVGFEVAGPIPVIQAFLPLLRER